jgi:leucine-rich PPR motif-containing protein
MFFHFSGLLSLSYASGLDFLVKDCLFALMVVLNMFIIEEGDLAAVDSLFGSSLESFSSKSSDKSEGVSLVSYFTGLLSFLLLCFQPINIFQ